MRLLQSLRFSLPIPPLSLSSCQLPYLVKCAAELQCVHGPRTGGCRAASSSCLPQLSSDVRRCRPNGLAAQETRAGGAGGGNGKMLGRFAAEEMFEQSGPKKQE